MWVRDWKQMYYKTLTGETVKNQNYLTDDTAVIKKPIIRQEVTVKNEKNIKIEL